MKKNILSLVLWGVLITTLLYAGLKDWETNPLQYVLYNSGWKYVGANSTYVFTHNLGSQPRIIQIYGSANADGSNAFIPVDYEWDGSAFNGIRIYSITSTSLTLNSGQGSYAGANYYKVIVIK